MAFLSCVFIWGLMGACLLEISPLPVNAIKDSTLSHLGGSVHITWPPLSSDAPSDVGFDIVLLCTPRYSEKLHLRAIQSNYSIH